MFQKQPTQSSQVSGLLCSASHRGCAGRDAGCGRLQDRHHTADQQLAGLQQGTQRVTGQRVRQGVKHVAHAAVVAVVKVLKWNGTCCMHVTAHAYSAGQSNKGP